MSDDSPAIWAGLDESDSLGWREPERRRLRGGVLAGIRQVGRRVAAHLQLDAMTIPHMTSHFEQARHAPIIVIEEPGRQTLLVAVVHPLGVGQECSGIVLTDPSISRRHLLVVAQGPTVRVTDLGTSNGPTVGGCALEPNHLLRLGEVVAFGASTLSMVAEVRLTSRQPNRALA